MDKKQKKFIDFIITQKCTYKCPYCSQSKNEARECLNSSSEVINSFFDFIQKLPRDYEITITGGEALLHPNFFDIIKKVSSLGFNINLITNFSFDIDCYYKIFSILNNSLKYFDISFHLDCIVDFDETIKKLENLINFIPEASTIRFFIPIYKLNNAKIQKINKLVGIAKKYNINYNFQHIRILNKFKNNSSFEDEYFKNQDYIHPSFATNCYAGCYSAVIYENGDVYRCYSSRFKKLNYLGNITDKNFKLNNSFRACTSKFCTCSKPFEYNQILSGKNYINAFFDTLFNLYYFPFLFFKNSKIVRTKLKQYINVKFIH